MKIIIDTSVVIDALIHADKLEKIKRATTGHVLYAPESLHWEMGNAISAMFKRKALTEEQGLSLLYEYSEIELCLVKIDLINATRIAAENNIYAYDAYMIQAATEHHCPLLSFDKQLNQVASELRIDLLEI